MVQSAESLVQHACEQAIRARLRDLDGDPDGGARNAARRTSLRVLQHALREDRLDGVQVHHLRQLVDHYEEQLLARRLPLWPGAEALRLRADADELVALAVARERLRLSRD